GYIVAANHSSHLDMGLVKHALGESGPALVALAAKDYFFEDPVRRMYFENFTNLVPMERHGSLRESLRLASGILPMYLAGCHDAMPKGAFFPRRGARVGARIGPFLSYDRMRALADGAGK